MRNLVSMKWPKIKIHFSLIAFFILSILFNNFKSFIIIYLVIILHELGHIVFIKIKKGKVFEISFSALGASMKTNCLNSQLVNFGRHH